MRHEACLSIDNGQSRPPSSLRVCYSYKENLQSVLKELVHARHLRRDAEVDGPLADLHDEAAADVRIDLSAQIC